MKTGSKGNTGYVRSQRIKRGIIMLVMFAIPIGLYYTALAVTGTQKNILTIVAVVGLIPAARFAVSFIMIVLAREADPEVVRVTRQYAPDLVHAFELTVTAYEGRLGIDGLVICGNEVMCASPGAAKEKVELMEKHITRILNSNGYFNTNVKIFTDVSHYADRIRVLAAHPEKYREGISFKPDEKYPNLSREELILHTIMAISV